MNFFKERIALAVFLLCFLGVSHAHDAAAVLLDPKNFIGMATVDCFPDNVEYTGEDTDHLFVRIKDDSPAIDGVSVSVHIFRYNEKNAINIATDPIPGDELWSPAVIVREGNGLYGMIVSKTGEGKRSFVLEYHCIAEDGSTHTGTGIDLLQFSNLPE